MSILNFNYYGMEKELTELSIEEQRQILCSVLAGNGEDEDKLTNAISLITGSDFELDLYVAYLFWGHGFQNFYERILKDYPQNIFEDFERNGKKFFPLDKCVFFCLMELKRVKQVLNWLKYNPEVFIPLAKEHFNWKSLLDVKLSSEQIKLIDLCDKWSLWVESGKFQRLVEAGKDDIVAKAEQWEAIKAAKNTYFATKYQRWDWLVEWEKWELLGHRGQFDVLAEEEQWGWLAYFQHYKIVNDHDKWHEALAFDKAVADLFKVKKNTQKDYAFSEFSENQAKPEFSNFKEWELVKQHGRPSDLGAALEQRKLWDKLAEYEFWDILAKNNRFGLLEKYGKMTRRLRIKRIWMNL